jgi:NADH-quinone oxidoreductase subunit N
MFFEEPADTAPIRGEVGATVLLAVNGLAMLGFGLLPDGLMSVCRDAVLKAIAT